MASALTVERVRIDSLIPHPQNARSGDVGAISESLEAHGQYRAIVVQASTRHVLAGNHTVKAANALGWTEIDAHFIDVTDEQALRILLVDNRANDLATYDDHALALLLTDLAQQTPQGLIGTGFDGDALDQLLADVAAQAVPPPAGDDAGPTEPPADPVTRSGDLWVLGEHRLLCGDARAADDYGTLIAGGQPSLLLTDPPYGINQRGIPGDGPEELVGLLQGALSAIPMESGIAVAFASTRTFPALLDAMRANGWEFERMLWLYKEAQNSYPWRGWLLKSEAILVSSCGDPQWTEVHPFTHDCYKVSEVSGEIDDAVGWHGSIKPLTVVSDLLARTSASNDLVLDPFAGSGTTLVACENLGRKARLIEIDPGYCDVIARRFQALTGVLPERDGTPHDFLADDPAKPGLLARAFRNNGT